MTKRSLVKTNKMADSEPSHEFFSISEEDLRALLENKDSSSTKRATEEAWNRFERFLALYPLSLNAIALCPLTCGLVVVQSVE